MRPLENAVWVERYRPNSIDECVLPESIKKTLKSLVEQGDKKFPNLLFVGHTGIGKTTAAIAMCKEMGVEYTLINASLYGNIDTLRTDIQAFASSSSFDGKRKVVILDEGDYLNAQSTQPALRNFMEQCYDNCAFIITANQPSRIIEPLHSRCMTITFAVPSNETQALAGTFFKRVVSILEENSVDYNKQVVAKVIMKYFPDFRRVLNELQGRAGVGINTGTLSSTDDSKFQEIVTLLQSKEYTKLRTWIGENSAFVYDTAFYTGLYKTLLPLLNPSCIGAVVVIIAEYAFRQTTIADREINAMACLSQLMAEARYT